MLTPLRPSAPRKDAPARRRAPRSGSRKISTGLAQAQHRRHAQQSLDFDQAGADSPPSGGGAETVIYCDAPVAAPVHRALAALFDGSMILIGVGAFLAVFYFSGRGAMRPVHAAPLLLGVTAALALLYRALWWMANRDTPGMIFAGLRLLDFDGRRADRHQRGLRQAASLLSILSVGVGLVWALVDEENLTWHDHISRTFPTTQW
jgi:uncharacterized RDD family membrane protein YckC